MGFGTEVLFIGMLGMLILGPKRLHTLLGQVAQAKAQLQEASRSFKSQLAAELDATHSEEKAGATRQLEGDR